MNDVFQKMKIPLIIAAVVLVLINLVVFFVPFTHGPIFWIAYGFLMFSIILQFVLGVFCYGKLFLPKKGIAYYPIIRFSFTYLIVQLILSIIFFALDAFISSDYFWIPLVICIIVLGIFAGIIFSAFGAIKIAENVEEKTKAEIIFIKSLTVDAEVLQEQTKDSELKKKLFKFYETVRYSDPVSSPELAEVESNIKEQFNLLKAAVALNDSAKADEILQKLDLLMYERNKKCKLLK